VSFDTWKDNSATLGLDSKVSASIVGFKRRGVRGMRGTGPVVEAV
jgi:hypothetical protein